MGETLAGSHLMPSCIAILTYNRAGALRAMLEGVRRHCAGVPVAVFEDAGFADETREELSSLVNGPLTTRPELAAEHGAVPGTDIFLGTENLGVAGNSNRALRWAVEAGYDHICLCNDDLIVSGDFVEIYRRAHDQTQCQFFCFSDFSEPPYGFEMFEAHGLKLKRLHFMTGIMLSLTSEVVRRIGYFDTRFPKMGEEHCDYNNRAYLAGLIGAEGQAERCIDVQHEALRHQEVASCLPEEQRIALGKQAQLEMARAKARYQAKDLFRPFSLRAEELAAILRSPDGS